MNKLLICALLVLSFILGSLGHPAKATTTAYASDKDYGAPTDPDRPSYDVWGNEFSYEGKLMSVGSCDSDPISGKPNPDCKPTPAPTSVPVSKCSN